MEHNSLHSCGKCDGQDDDAMVQCDECDAWYHFKCVQVNEEIANCDWSCDKCIAAKAGAATPRTLDASSSDQFQSPMAKRGQSNDHEQHSVLNSDAGDIKVRIKNKVDIELRRLEEEKQLELLYLRRKYKVLQLNDAVETVQATKVTYEHECEEWPIFFSSYENSTRMCKFTNSENLLRLQRALKGKAFECVSSQLMLPELVPEIIGSLRMIFGRPELIINSLLSKLRSSPNVNPSKLETLVSFALEVKNLTAAMAASGLHAHMANPLLLQEMVEKLPAQMKLNWAIYSRPIIHADLSTFTAWVYQMAEAASSVISSPAAPTVHNTDRHKLNQRVGFHKIEEDKAKGNCVICGGAHNVPKCNNFLKMKTQERWDTVHKEKLCRTCLKAHNLTRCSARESCGVHRCTAKHHPLLHKDNGDTDKRQTNHSVLTPGNKAEDEVVAIHATKTSSTLYKIVPVTVYGKNTTANTYALLDDGSGPTIIEESILRLLQTTGHKKDLCLRWTDGSTRIECDSEQLDLPISPKGRPEKKFILQNVRSVKQLDLPTQTLIVPDLAAKYHHLRGLPVESCRNATPKIIIGLNNRKVAMPLKFREGRADEPAATKKRLVWTIFGVLPEANEPGHVNAQLQMHICECDDEIALQKLFSEYMAMEEVNLKTAHQHKPNPEYDKILAENVSRHGGRFVAKLLWKEHIVELPDNHEMAVKRLQCFERKLRKTPTLHERVNNHISGMVAKGYARKLSEAELATERGKKWYLPIFVVHNANKPQKLRIVWDAAASYRGMSLNTCLQKGPDLLTPLREVLFNFRLGRIGVCGDIREMFHRIGIDEDDAQCQRFLWRPDPRKIPEVYVMQVLSFGTSCSPSIAQYAKNKNAKDYEDEFPRAAKSLMKRHYADDMLDSSDCVEEAIQLAKDVKEVHKRGNFHIRNWLSNSEEVIRALGDESDTGEFCKAGTTVDYVIEPEKVLGLWWHTTSDCFTFNLRYTKASDAVMRCERRPTKREVLRLMMSIFDPLGFLSFFTINVKIIMQNVWRSQVEWDEPITNKDMVMWTEWMSHLHKVQDVRVPRWYFGGSDDHNRHVELHVMVDASVEAYAALAYLRTQTKHGVAVSFVCSRSKVAPLKPVSIPRLELMAAVMGTRLGEEIITALDTTIGSKHYWTDSTTVLSWIRSDPRAYKQFVMFRVAEIQDTSDVKNWHYVPTKQNVADLATKWNRQPRFDHESSWFTGPEFLRLQPSSRPKQQIHGNTHPEELRTTAAAALCAVQVHGETALLDTHRFSKWERLLRCMAYVLRFISRVKNAVRQKQSVRVAADVVLSHDELRDARRMLFGLAQAETFGKELAALRKDPGCKLPKHSQLIRLSPFIDSHGVLRMYGRLREGPYISDDIKAPVILPKTHYITRLLIDHYHRKLKHINHETVINEVFQEFYVAGLRKLLRSVRNNCQHCKIRQAKPTPPQMGPLPEARVAAFSRPFTYVGVDFFGPLSVTVGRRTEKRYGVVFTCLTCRAVHVEVAYSLSMNSCVMAIRNFIARRGSLHQFFSNNGTNLRASEKELREAYKRGDFGSLQSTFTDHKTEWSFLPPASPHMGGAWERLVRSIKTVLYQIITPDTKLSDEKLLNFLVEVESIINQRPLTYLSLETATEEVLTPNHFLLGSSSGDKPLGRFDDKDQFVKLSWRHSQLLADKFWKRWVNEYLPTLTRRTKWFVKTQSIELGDVVIIVDANLPRHRWPKGIVSKVFTGPDCEVRSALVRTTTGEYHRPVAKIALLDVREKHRQSPRQN